MAVIELGLLSPGGDEPAGTTARPPLPRASRRKVLAVAVTVLCLLTATGSARPDPEGFTRLWSAPFGREGDTFRLDDGSVYLLGTTGGRHLTALDARTGAVRWKITDIEESAWINTVEAGVLLMPTGTITLSTAEPDGTTSYRSFNRDTRAISTATGHQLWRRRGEVTAVLGDRVLLSEWNSTGERTRGLRAIRVRDGSTVWTRTGLELNYSATDTVPEGRPERLVTVDTKGNAEVLSLTDGSVVTRGALPWVGESSNDDYSSINVHGRRVYVDRTIRKKSSVSVYDTETLRPLWQIELDSPGGTYPCGPVVCVSRENVVSGHDSGTGALLWRISGAANGYPLPQGGLLLEDPGSGNRRVADSRTGRILAELGPATPVWDSAGRGTPYLIARTLDPPGRTSVSSFDPDTGEVLLRGAIGPVLDYACQNEGTLLACLTDDNRMTVTDVG